MPLRADTTRIHHVQIGVLAVAEPSLLKGYYDICFGIPQGHIYPCHMGCLINLIDGRTTDETGEVGVCFFLFLIPACSTGLACRHYRLFSLLFFIITPPHLSAGGFCGHGQHVEARHRLGAAKQAPRGDPRIAVSVVGGC
jgi:hypothetical protein